MGFSVRILATVSALATLIVLASAGSSNAAQLRCELSPFYFSYVGTPLFSTLPNGDIRVTWDAVGVTTLSCPGSAFNGRSAEVHQRTFMDYTDDACAVQGRVLTRLVLTRGGATLDFRGRLRGEAPCAGEVGEVLMDTTGHAPGGARLQTSQEMTLDVGASRITGHEMTHGVLALPR